MTHARRAFFDLFESSKSPVAGQAVKYFDQLYDIERELKDLPPDERRHRQQQQVKKLDYSLKRWDALTRYLEDGRVPMDSNNIERQIQPIAIGRLNWLFAGSLRAGKQAAAAMSLIQSVKLNRHDPYAYLKDVLTRLPTHRKHPPRAVLTV
jgi:hypothetical protein